jgi:hypothetical protein
VKKTLFGFSAVALAAAAIVLPAAGASMPNDSQPATAVVNKIDGNGGAPNPGDGAMVFNFSKIETTSSTQRD